MEKIPVTLTTHYKEKPVGSDIPFGVIMTDDMFLMNRALGFGFLDFSFMGIVLFPIYGFLIVIVARVVAEVYRALAAIANNTKKS